MVHVKLQPKLLVQDLAFVAYYVVFFSFVRQSLTIYTVIPFAQALGVKRESKLERCKFPAKVLVTSRLNSFSHLFRFAEQGYAVLYFGIFGSLGLYTMSRLPTWGFRTEHFWLGKFSFVPFELYLSLIFPRQSTPNGA